MISCIPGLTREIAICILLWYIVATRAQWRNMMSWMARFFCVQEILVPGLPVHPECLEMARSISRWYSGSCGSLWTKVYNGLTYMPLIFSSCRAPVAHLGLRAPKIAKLYIMMTYYCSQSNRNTQKWIGLHVVLTVFLLLTGDPEWLKCPWLLKLTGDREHQKWLDVDYFDIQCLPWLIGHIWHLND